FMAERRIKEIGIRKVLGASAARLWLLLSSEFVYLVMIGSVIAAAIAYWLMSDWLQQYDYRIGIHWWVFFSAGAGALLIALLTVSMQAVRAALSNPIDSLRSE
ncbi:MAG TPA: FtsX-like permease family protein, partial [Chryseolinea sp.]|nr:FtsX-like permease family protein [Chryseolinea sp.]